MALIDKETIPQIQSLNRDHIARIIELWQDVEHDVEWCNEPSEFMYDEVLRRFNLDTLPEQPELKPMNIPSAGGAMSTTPPSYKLDVKKNWHEENASHGAFALTQNEIDFYYKKEQPVEGLEKDLEKEIDAIWNPRFNLGWDDYSLLSMNHAGFASIARHFAEWGADHLRDSTKMVPEGLEEAADKYAERLTTEPYLQVVHKTDFIAGAEWQKEQGVTVKGYVMGAPRIFLLALKILKN